MLVHDWLVCGPLLNALNDFLGVIDAHAPAYRRAGRWSISNAPDANSLKSRVARRFPRVTPVEVGEAREGAAVQVQAASGTWRWYSTPEDGLVDFTLFAFTPLRLTGLAATTVRAPETRRYRMCLESNSPLSVWIDGRRVTHSAAFSYMDTRPNRFEVRLTKGSHQILLVGEHVAFRESRLIFALEMDDALELRPAPALDVSEGDLVLAGGAARTAGPRSDDAYGSYQSRAREALEYASSADHSVSAALARLALGRSQSIAPGDLEFALTAIEERHDCADFEALGLLTMLARSQWADKVPGQLRERTDAALLGFKYWLAEPGLDGMCFHTENHQLVFHVAELLAGQLYADQVFTNVRQPGTWHAARGEQRVRRWLRDRLRGGFSEWDSNAYVAIDVFALLVICEHAAQPDLRRMATALLDLIFFQLAVNSWRGIHGCSHGRTYAPALADANLEATSGLQRIAWGLGAFNDEDRATVMLASSSAYCVPGVIQRIGADVDARFTARGRAANRFRVRFDLSAAEWEVNTLVHRGPHGMLACAQDYRPGSPGLQEHIWQATLGPRAVAFVTHPANSSRSPSARPNYWAGNAILPRAAQHENELIALYEPSAERGLRFTHAYFPTPEFDEWCVVGKWAAARLGDGYLALGSDSELTLRGDGRELRPSEAGRVWACRLGDRETDGTFAEFTARIFASRPELHSESVARWTAADHTLELGREGVFLVDGAVRPLGSYPRFNSPYARAEMGEKRLRITCGDEHLQLDLR